MKLALSMSFILCFIVSLIPSFFALGLKKLFTLRCFLLRIQTVFQKYYLKYVAYVPEMH